MENSQRVNNNKDIEMKIYLLWSGSFGFTSFHGVMTEKEYLRKQKSLKNKAIFIQSVDTEMKVDIRKLPNKRRKI